MIAQKIKKSFGTNFSENFRNQCFLKYFGLTKVPLIFYVSPKLEEVNSDRCEISIPLIWRTKNHLGSMYFGVLATGADLAGGLIAMNLIERSPRNIALVFKDFKADFLKRAEGRTHFICEDGPKIQTLMEKVIATGERHNEIVNIIATVPTQFGDDPVARFALTLSLKDKTKN